MWIANSGGRGEDINSYLRREKTPGNLHASEVPNSRIGVSGSTPVQQNRYTVLGA